jgi:GNAT superfamily N-acetyltransferase
MDVTIRPARPDEAPALSDLALRAKGHWGYDAAFLEACREELRVDPADCDGRSVVVADAAGVLIGFYQLLGEPPVGELADLFVDPPAIGRGVGGRLLAHAHAGAAARGFRTLTIDADPNAESFYRHAGAVRVGEVASGSIAGRRLPRLELAV